ncbi:hypothetical protein IKO70_05045 [bacterium]|jgi:hypothetical protein|nr:hypothetical protein [bacterium]
MTNLGLKLKVFFLMAVVITALSAANFLLFKDFLVKIDVQDGAKNIAKLVESELKSKNYSLIGNSFEIARQLKIEKGKVTSKITSEKDYAIVGSNGAVIDGNFNAMSSFAGIPAVERALKDGAASDGMFSNGSDIYLIGAVPVSADGNKIFAAITFEKFGDELLSVFPMPARAFRGSNPIAEKGGDRWGAVENSYGKAALDADTASLITSGGQKELNGWTRISAFAMPYDLAGGDKITIVTMTSLIPGWESYDNVLYMTVVYAVIAILVALFFTFIVTHEIDKILKNLASDISRMRVGEKLVLKRYSNGADIVVSAMNKLIQKYLELNEDVGGITSSPLVRAEKSKADDFEDAVPDPFGTGSVEEIKPEKVAKQAAVHTEMPKKDVATNQHTPVHEAKPEMPKTEHTMPAQVEDDYDDDDDNEKTQIAPSLGSAAQNSGNPFDALWEDYCRIKRKHGESVSDKEKTAFIGKVRTNKASIMAKYKCSDVQFSVEDKDGKPVIKAKPVN